MITINFILSIIEHVRKLSSEINNIQRNLNSAYQDFVHLTKNIIRICRNHSIVVINFINSLSKSSALINNLYNFIINYETVHKPSSYIQKKMKNETFYTNRQYHRHESNRDCDRDRFKKNYDNFFKPSFRRIKKCFVCNKIDC